jgi:hypothetical protein
MVSISALTQSLRMLALPRPVCQIIIRWLWLFVREHEHLQTDSNHFLCGRGNMYCKRSVLELKRFCVEGIPLVDVTGLESFGEPAHTLFG